MALVEQAAIEELLQGPPHTLDITLVEGDIGLLQIHPEADAVGQLFPLLLIAEDRLDTGAVKLLDAVVLDGRLAAVQDAELLADLDLHRQAVGVPARLALAIVPGHRLVAREDVLDRPRQAMVRMRQPVRGGRSLVEHEGRRAFPLRQALVVGVVLLPEANNLVLGLGEIEGRGYRAKHVFLGHGKGILA